MAGLRVSLLALGHLCLAAAMQHRGYASSKAHRSLLEVLEPLLQGCEGLDCLQRYVDYVDPVYAWANASTPLAGVDEETGVAWTGHVLNMTSQQWLTAKDTDSSIWWHPLAIIVPSNLEFADWCTVVVGGDHASNDDFLRGGQPLSALQGDVQAAVALATRTRALSAALLMVPNQPVTILETGPAPRIEDDLKSKSWMEASLHADQPEWPIEMPDAKAVVRAMDTIAAFSGGLPSGAVTRFGATGCSKRAVAVWHAGAVDSRVEALMPCNIGMNMNDEASDDMVESYGGVSYAMADYLPMIRASFGPQITNAKLEEIGKKVTSITDPYFVLDAVAGREKLILWAGNDQFFSATSTAGWLGAVPEPKRFTIAPNTKHQGVLQKDNFIPMAAAFVEGLLVDAASLPKIAWTLRPENATIEATLVNGRAPSSVKVWTALSNSRERRDFRWETFDQGEACSRIGHPEPLPAGSGSSMSLCVTNEEVARYSSSELEETSPGSRRWQARIKADPEGRWAVSFVQFTFAPLQAGGDPLTLSTEAIATPDTYPFKRCTILGGLEALCDAKTDKVVPIGIV